MYFLGNFQWPFNRPKTSAAEAEDGILKSFGIGRLCLASVILRLWPLAKSVQNWIVARSTSQDLKVFKFKGTFRPVCTTQATFMDQKLASELLQSKPDGTTLLTTKEERLLIYFLVLPGLLYLRGFIYTFINLKDLKFFLLDMNMDQTFQFWKCGMSQF